MNNSKFCKSHVYILNQLSTLLYKLTISHSTTTCYKNTTLVNIQRFQVLFIIKLSHCVVSINESYSCFCFLKTPTDSSSVRILCATKETHLIHFLRENVNSDGNLDIHDPRSIISAQGAPILKLFSICTEGPKFRCVVCAFCCCCFYYFVNFIFSFLFIYFFFKMKWSGASGPVCCWGHFPQHWREEKKYRFWWSQQCVTE